MSNKKVPIQSETTLEVATRLNTVVTRLGRRIRRIDDRQSIGRARLSALSVLVFGGPCSMSELAAEEMVSAATMHHVVKGLMESGYVSREADDQDARRYVISATKSGLEFMGEARQARLEFYCDRLEQLSPEERQAVVMFARVAGEWLD